VDANWSDGELGFWYPSGHEESLPDGSPVYSFHMVLSCSRDPFCLYVSRQDLTTFWACHAAAFAHFGGVPGEIVYDRTKTVVRRHVGRGEPVDLHSEAVAFAAHCGFAIRVCWPERPQAKGRVERMVELTREKVAAGRELATLEEWQAAWEEWLPTRRAQVHRTHGEVIAVRAEADRAALLPLPERPYVVCERHLRVVGKDALVSFEASLYFCALDRGAPAPAARAARDDRGGRHLEPGERAAAPGHPRPRESARQLGGGRASLGRAP